MNKPLLTAVVVVAAVLILISTYGDKISQHMTIIVTENDPMDVARDFWTHEVLDDTQSALSLATNVPGTLNDILLGAASEDRVSLGMMEQDQGVYFIKTYITVYRQQRYYNTQLYTVVTSVDGAYRVDVSNTLNSFLDASTDNLLDRFESASEVYTRFLPDTTDQIQRDPEFKRITEHNLQLTLCDVGAKLFKSMTTDENAALSMCANIN